MTVNSLGTISQIPSAGRALEYRAYISGHPALEGDPLYLSFDYLWATSTYNDDAHIGLVLENVEVRSWPLESVEPTDD